MRPNLSRAVICALALFVAVVGSVRGEDAEPKILEDLAYKTTGDDYEKERCKLNLYIPAGKKDFATIVWFHGGGITEGSKQPTKNMSSMGRIFARDGVAFADVNYRLSPKAQFPAYVDDTAAAAAWVRAHIAEYGGDPSKVFISGHSAGGYLTLIATLDPKYLKKYELEPKSFAGLIPISGQTLTHFSIRLERGMKKETGVADEAAPIYFAATNAKLMPPMLILVGEGDKMLARVEENQLLYGLLKGGGAKGAVLRVMEGRDHGSIVSKFKEPNDPVRTMVLEFIQSVTEKKAAPEAELAPK